MSYYPTLHPQPEQQGPYPPVGAQSVHCSGLYPQTPCQQYCLPSSPYMSSTPSLVPACASSGAPFPTGPTYPGCYGGQAYHPANNGCYGGLPIAGGQTMTPQPPPLCGPSYSGLSAASSYPALHTSTSGYSSCGSQQMYSSSSCPASGFPAPAMPHMQVAASHGPQPFDSCYGGNSSCTPYYAPATVPAPGCHSQQVIYVVEGDPCYHQDNQTSATVTLGAITGAVFAGIILDGDDCN